MPSSKASLFIALIACSTLFLNVLSQTTSFQIDDFAASSTNSLITFQRDAHVPSGSTFLRLIKTDSSGRPAKSSVGRALFKIPITFWTTGKQLSFEVTLQFKITSHDKEPADGLTFFIVPDGSITSKGGEGNGLGIFGALTPNSSSHMFATDFDTYINRDQGEKYRQIGIDIGPRPSKNTTRLEDGALDIVVTARINYEATTRRITVFLTFGLKTSSVSYVYDLKKILPSQVQIGVSASTGANTALFDLLKFYFTGTLVADNNREETYLEQFV